MSDEFRAYRAWFQIGEAEITGWVKCLDDAHTLHKLLRMGQMRLREVERGEVEMDMQSIKSGEGWHMVTAITGAEDEAETEQELMKLWRELTKKRLRTLTPINDYEPCMATYEADGHQVSVWMRSLDEAKILHKAIGGEKLEYELSGKEKILDDMEYIHIEEVEPE